MAAMLVSLFAVTGCSNNGGGDNGEITLTWYVPGDKQADMASVMEEVNKITMEKIGAKLDIQFIDTGAYAEKMRMFMASGQEFDLAFTGYINEYYKAASEGGLMDITDIIKNDVPGILEVIAVEYYANETEDDIEAGIVGGLIEEPKDPNGDEPMEIVGETFIKVKKEYKFHFDGTYSADWTVDSKYPVVLIPDTKDPRNITLKWDNPYSGQFDLHYGDYSKTIVVESLF